MRGHKRADSVARVSRLLCWVANAQQQERRARIDQALVGSVRGCDAGPSCAGKQARHSNPATSLGTTINKRVSPSREGVQTTMTGGARRPGQECSSAAGSTRGAQALLAGGRCKHVSNRRWQDVLPGVVTT